MRVRTQLIVAFVGLAVIPMAGLTLYSYLSSIRAFRQAVHAEAASTASQMGERMRFRKSNLNRRLSRLSRVQFEELLGDRASDQAPVFYDSLVREMGSDASLLESLEFRPMAPPPSTSPPAPVAARASAPEVKSGQSARGSEKRGPGRGGGSDHHRSSGSFRARDKSSRTRGQYPGRGPAQTDYPSQGPDGTQGRVRIGARREDDGAQT